MNTARELERLGSRALIKIPEYEEIRTDELWKDSTVVITYLRRFSCFVCRQAAIELSKITPLLRSNGIRPLIIGLGKVGLEEFQAANYFDGEIFLDCKKEHVPAHGFRRFNSLNVWWKTGWDGVTECSKRERSTRPARGLDHDGFQCGGTLIVEQGGKSIIMSQKQGRLRDHVTNGKILKALGISESPPALLPRRRRLSTIPAADEEEERASERRSSLDTGWKWTEGTEATEKAEGTEWAEEAEEGSTEDTDSGERFEFHDWDKQLDTLSLPHEFDLEQDLRLSSSAPAV